jgi:hypothetical protein
MIEFFESVPGWLIRFGTEHWFWAALIVIFLLSAGYYGFMRLGFALEDAKDIRNRDHR